MACKKTSRATRGKKAPRPAAPQKAAKKKVKKITRSVAAADAAAAKRSATARRREQTKGRKTNSFVQAMGLIPRRYELLLRHPSTKRFVQINGPAEEGCEGKHCYCLAMNRSSCKKHPSRIKVRTGHFIACPTKAYPNKRRAVWVPKVLVDKGIITVKKDVKFRCNKMNGKAL